MDNITEIHNALQQAINEICLLPQSEATSKHILKAANYINTAMLRLPTIRHDEFRKLETWIEPIEN